MSAYKLIEVSKDSTGKESQSIYSHTDMTALLAAMNNDFGVMVKVENTVSVYCIAIDNENGSKVDGCYWSMPIVIEPPTEGGEEPDIPDVSIRPRVYTHNDYSEDNLSPYETEKLAIGNYHTKKAAAMNRPECDHAITILLDGKGGYMEFSNWIRN